MGRLEFKKLTAVLAALLSSLGCRNLSTQEIARRPTPTRQIVDSPEVVEPITLVQYDDSSTRNESGSPTRLPEPVATPQPAHSMLATGQPVEYFVGIALSCHPRIRAARARVAAASHRAAQVQSLEDPILSNSFYPISDQALQTAAGRAGNTLALTQKYPWPDKRWTKAAIACRETQIAAAGI